MDLKRVLKMMKGNLEFDVLFFSFCLFESMFFSVYTLVPF